MKSVLIAQLGFVAGAVKGDIRMAGKTACLALVAKLKQAAGKQ
jgi:hypothetical protein